MNQNTELFYLKMVLLTFFVSTLSIFVNAQTMYQYAVGTDRLELGRTMALLPDGQIIIGGQTQPVGADEFDMLLLRIDQEGGVIWSNAYGAEESELIAYVEPTADAILVAAEKYRQNANEGENLLLMKTDHSGNVIWKKLYYEGAGESEGFSAIATQDGGYLITGIRKGLLVVSNAFYTMKEEKQSLYLLKVDANGNKQWSKVYEDGDNTLSSVGMMIRATKDGNFLIAGNLAKGKIGLTEEENIESRNIVLLKIDQNGKLLWTRKYESEDLSIIRDMAISANGEVTLVGEAEIPGTDNTDVFMLRLAEDGRVKWAKTYGGTDYESANTLMVADDGGLLLGGSTRSFGAGLDDALLMKTDEAGQLLWAKTYGSGSNEMFHAMVKTSDGYILTGEAFHPNNNHLDVYFVKTNKQGESPCNNMAININPRPATITYSKGNDLIPKLVNLNLEISDETNLPEEENADFIKKVSCEISVVNICQ